MASAFAVTLHMHQPLIPAGGPDLRTAPVIGNLQWMLDNPGIGDNHNAPVFLWCYKRMGEFVPQLLDEGLAPRVMLEYSGTLLHGLRQMGADDVLDALAGITTGERSRQAVEWLGCPWGHAVAPSTPVQDYRLHVRAWQHHFAALFGLDALRRVRGFSPAEMALPNHPDVAYEFVKTLTDCGYQWILVQWILVQEHTVEEPDGSGLQRPHLPHRLVCASSAGEVASITAVVKTQGSDTKLVGQMQPYYEAKGLSRQDLGGRAVPPLVTQIADGENGGVMMNDFPPKYFDVIRECSGTQTPAVNVTEYLERLRSAGIGPGDLPVIYPVFQSRIWGRMAPGDGPDRLADVIEQLKGEGGRFHMEGGSWTSNISWVRGYERVLAPMDEASSLFHERVLAKAVRTDDPRYRNALFHLLTAETSCYRYWGEGHLDRLRRRTGPAHHRHRHLRPVRLGGTLMANVAFAMVLNLHQPAGNLEDLLDQRAWEAREILWAMDRIPRSLWAYEDVGRVHLSLSGTLLETLASPGFQSRVYGVVDCGSLLWYLQNTTIIRILGTGYYHPVLPLIPHADWDEQLERWQGIGRHLFARTSFPGFWPPEMGFCMELIPALKRQHYRYVIVDSEHVEPVTPMGWDELRYRPHIARFGGEEITVVVRDRELSDAQEAGMDAGWFIYEVAQRTRHCDFLPLVTTCTDGDNGGWFRNTSPQANFWHVFYRDLLQRARDNRSEGIRPCFIEDYLDRHGAHGEVTVRPGAWNTGWHNGSGFTQWIGSPAQQRALTRLDEISQAIYAARRNAIGIGVRDPEVYRLLEEARWRVLRAETSCNFFWGQAWLQRCHDDLDRATGFLDQAGSHLASHQPLDSRRP